MNGTILILDTDDLQRRRLRQVFRHTELETIEVADVVEALLRILRLKPDLILLSEEVPPLRADDVLPLLRRLSDAPIMVIGTGGEGDEEEVEVAMLEMGADFYLRPPASDRTVVAHARALIRRYQGHLAARAASDGEGNEEAVGNILHIPTRRVPVFLSSPEARRSA